MYVAIFLFFLFFYLFIYLFIYLFTYLFIYLFIYLSIYFIAVECCGRPSLTYTYYSLESDHNFEVECESGYEMFCEVCKRYTRWLHDYTVQTSYY